MLNVIKRNGKAEPFKKEKIVQAILGANKSVSPEAKLTSVEAEQIAEKIEKRFLKLKLKEVEVEEIQDLVEELLSTKASFEFLKAYMLYRYKHNILRQINKTDESILKLIQNKNKEMTEENSNKNTKLASTQRDYIAGIISRDITDRILLPEHISQAHKDGILHFHDADYFLQNITNCCLINISDMLDNGTVINGKMVESPKTFRVACTIMTQIIACVASNQYGGQSVDIRHLGKYLRKSIERFEDEGFKGEQLELLIKQELAAGVQTIQYQINTLMTTNGQSPFVTLFMYLKKDDPYKAETAMIIEEILKQRYLGIKNEVGVYITPAFPKLIYVLTEENCLKGGEYDYLTKLAVKCSAKRMYPDYISEKKMAENYEGNVFSPMGCRSFLAPWKNEQGEYQFEGRFNQGVVSINLPQIGIIAKGDMDVFWTMLDERCELCKEALMCRHKALLGTLSDISPIHWQYGACARLPKNTPIDPLLFGGYSSISLGYIGIYEVTKLMTGVSQTDPIGKEFALKVMQFLKDKVLKWRKETNIGFALYGTPAESLCYRFAKIDRERFGDIPDITDKGYYTNSYHIDVREPIDAFSKFKLESEFQALSQGGCISYSEIPNMSHNLTALEDVVKYIYDNIQYAEFNTKSDYCQNCGYDGEIMINENNEWECPICHNKDHSKMNVTRRVCGYLGENFFNEGKTKEIKARVLHL